MTPRLGQQTVPRDGVAGEGGDQRLAPGPEIGREPVGIGVEWNLPQSFR